jgi:hypothetical protein
MRRVAGRREREFETACKESSESRFVLRAKGFSNMCATS